MNGSRGSYTFTIPFLCHPSAGTILFVVPCVAFDDGTTAWDVVEEKAPCPACGTLYLVTNVGKDAAYAPVRSREPDEEGYARLRTTYADDDALGSRVRRMSWRMSARD